MTPLGMESGRNKPGTGVLGAESLHVLKHHQDPGRWGKWKLAGSMDVFLNKTSTTMESLHATNTSSTERQMRANIKNWGSKMY